MHPKKDKCYSLHGESLRTRLHYGVLGVMQPRYASLDSFVPLYTLSAASEVGTVATTRKPQTSATRMSTRHVAEKSQLEGCQLYILQKVYS